MNQLWGRALEIVRTKISQEGFSTWFAPIQCGGVIDGSLVLRIPNQFYAEWIGSHYQGVLLEALRSEGMEAGVQIDWQVDATIELDASPSTPRVDEAPKPTPVASPIIKNTSLNPKYDFETFVVGPANQLAHAASAAVGSAPGTRYNPLFIYGGVGLGKTHLMNAIGHRILTDNPSSQIFYLSAEQFTNEFIWALKNHTINDFRKRYRSDCDVLLMDDIQFLAGREQTQEEFFHTFNSLYHQDKQIVVTSDVYPHQIQEMEERLISRFQSGLVADIQMPELDTRIAILHKKAEQETIRLRDDVALFLAQTVRSNVRELEGTLIRLAVKAELMNRQVDLELCKETMRVTMPAADKATTVEDIQRAVCDYYGVRLSDLKGRRRHRNISFPRMVAMYLARQRVGSSFPDLGHRFGGKDHTTVINAVRKISRLVDEDESVRIAVDAIDRKLGL